MCNPLGTNKYFKILIAGFFVKLNGSRVNKNGLLVQYDW